MEFVAPRTGTYTIYAIRSSADTSNEANHLSIAWTRQATYLPDVLRNSSGWSSSIAIRNDGTLARPVRVTFISENGANAYAQDHGGLAAGATWYPPFPGNLPNPFTGHVVVDGNEDLSVAVVQERSSPNTRDTYLGIAYPDTEIHVPLLHRNNSVWNSKVFIQNVGGDSATVRLDFFALVGRDCLNKSYVVSPGGRFYLPMTSADLTCLDDPNDAYPDRFVGSARIVSTNGQPIAVVSTQFNGETSFMSAANQRAFQTTLQTPLIQNNNGTPAWSSSFNLQNGAGSPQSFNVVYFNQNGSICRSSDTYTVSGYDVANVLPAPPSGSGCSAIASARFGNNQVAVAQVNQLQAGTAQASTYAAIGYPSRLIIVPRLLKTNGWNDGFVVRNVNNSSVTLTISYYNPDGSLSAFRTPPQLAANSNRVFLVQGAGQDQIPSGLSGSAVIEASGPVAVSVNLWKEGSGGDELGSHPAVHR